MTVISCSRLSLTTLAAALLVTGTACARNTQSASGPADKSAAEPASKLRQTGRAAGEVVMQPAKDVGVARTEIPPVLEMAAVDPYSLKGLRTCRQLSAAVTELNAELGPDFKVGSERKKENRAGRLAEAGGKTIVNSIIPFRGLVREITGAAPAQRRLNAAIDAGYARRGFLRGVHSTRKCRTPF